MWPVSTRRHPERRRVLIIGAGPTGMSTAFHLGEHSLLLERRHSLEPDHDYTHDFPMGTAHGGAVGDQDADADGGFATPLENKTLFISCSSQAHADSGKPALIHVQRWQPPAFSPPRERSRLGAPPSVRTLRPLLRGELRLDAEVVRISPLANLVELADGHQYVYDKLVSTVSLEAIEFLVAQDLPAHVRRGSSLRYWLNEYDIEVADRTIQDYYGDLDEFAAGKRIADQVGQELAAKFSRPGRAGIHGGRLSRPRLIKGSSTPGP
jgi:hypothetical protein